MIHVLATLILGEWAFRPTNLIRSGPQKYKQPYTPHEGGAVTCLGV